VELAAGTVGEEELIEGPTLEALDDCKQSRMLARLVSASPRSVEAFLEFSAAEAKNLIVANRAVVLQLAAELVARRTMNGDQITEFVVAALLAAADLEAEKRRRADMTQMAENARAFAIYTKEKPG
jgi:hypothetical protein